MLLNRQKPMLRTGVAWCPGGRTRQRAVVSGPFSTLSTAALHAPAAASATRNDFALTTVSGSMRPPPCSASCLIDWICLAECSFATASSVSGLYVPAVHLLTNPAFLRAALREGQRAAGLTARAGA